MKIDIDFIIPVLNGESTVGATIDSILNMNQQGFHFHIYVVDNGSTDDSEKIIKRYNVTYLSCLEQGRSNARNFGIASSKSEYICFVDCDVVLDSHWLNNLFPIIQPNCVGIAQGAIIPVSFNESKININESDMKLADRWRYKQALEFTNGSFILLDSNYMSAIVDTAACITKRSVLKKVGEFNPKLMRGEDYDLSLRMLNFGFSLRGFDHAKAFKTHEYGFSSFSYALREFYQGYSQSKYIASCSNINKGNFFSSYRAAYFHFVHPHFKSLKSDDLFAYFISLSKFLGMVTGSIRGRLTREKIVLLVKKYPVLLTLKIKGFDQQDYVLHPKARLLVTNNRAKLLSPITDMFLDTNDKNMIYLFNRLLDQEYVNLYDFNEFTTDEMELIKENMNKMIKNNSLILKSQLWKFLN